MNKAQELTASLLHEADSSISLQQGACQPFDRIFAATNLTNDSRRFSNDCSLKFESVAPHREGGEADIVS